jgi:hypothetical protein
MVSLVSAVGRSGAVVRPGPLALETWQFEREMCERVARQFRCVGDALAWRVFGFERRNILALCQNDPPGVWAGKAGALAELDAVGEAYRQDGQFAILHDMTNCLRIGDMTIFRNDARDSRDQIRPAAGPFGPAAAHQRCERGFGERCSATGQGSQSAALRPGRSVQDASGCAGCRNRAGRS